MAQYVKYTKQQAISVVVSCAKKYREELEDKSLLFVCQDKHKNISHHEVSFYARNFLHLTGLKVKKGNSADELTARNFYEKCLSRRLSPNDFEFSDDGTIFMKLEVLPALITKNLSAQMIGDYNLSKPKLYTEKLAGNVKACMGFRVDDMTGDFVPDTVLNEDVRNMTTKCVRIVATYRKNIQESHYEELTYIAKGIDLSMLHFPEEVQALPG